MSKDVEDLLVNLLCTWVVCMYLAVKFTRKLEMAHDELPSCSSVHALYL